MLAEESIPFKVKPLEINLHMTPDIILLTSDLELLREDDVASWDFKLIEE